RVEATRLAATPAEHQARGRAVHGVHDDAMVSRVGYEHPTLLVLDRRHGEAGPRRVEPGRAIAERAPRPQQAARPARESARQVEGLDTMVEGVRHQQVAPGRDRRTVGRLELARLDAALAEGHEPPGTIA